MQPTKSIIACPHCGGVSGYQTNIVFKAVRLYAWHGNDLDTEDYQVASETSPKCIDCGKSVRGLVK